MHIPPYPGIRDLNMVHPGNKTPGKASLYVTG